MGSSDPARGCGGALASAPGGARGDLWSGGARRNDVEPEAATHGKTWEEVAREDS